MLLVLEDNIDSKIADEVESRKHLDDFRLQNFVVIPLPVKRLGVEPFRLIDDLLASLDQQRRCAFDIDPEKPWRC